MTTRTRERKNGDAPNEELSNRGGPLDESETDGFDVKFEEDPWDARMRFEFPFVVCDAILIRL